jgi:RNA polymerase subunit RPABC4/transcription elongation factor Spt4
MIVGAVLNIISGGTIILPAIGCGIVGYMLEKRSKSHQKTLAPRPSTAQISQGRAYPQNLGRQKLPMNPQQARSLPIVPRTAQLQCRNCGAIVKAGQSFCSKCGSQTVPTSAPRRDQGSSDRKYTPELVNAQTTRCRNCGASVMIDYRFCRKCGFDLGIPSRQESSVRKYSPENITTMLKQLRDKDRSSYMNLVPNLVMVDDRERYWSIGAETSQWYLLQNGSWVAGQPTGMMRMKRRTKLAKGRRKPVSGITPAHSSAVCPSCNSPVRPSQVFCIKCGGRLPRAGPE